MQQNTSLLRAMIDNWYENSYRDRLWQSYPQGIDCADLCQLDVEGEDKASLWLQQLLSNQELKVEITTDSSAVFKLRHLYFEARNREIHQGISPLGIGYPAFLQQNEENPFLPFCAPVIIWPVKLTPSPNRLDIWHLELDRDAAPRINPLLLHKWKKEWPELPWKTLAEKLYTGSWTGSDILKWCHRIAHRFELDFEPVDKGIKAFPTQRQADILGEKGAIVPAGTLSLFPMGSIATVQALEEAMERSDEELEETEKEPQSAPSKSWHPFGLSMVTPPQQSVIMAGHQHEITMACGPRGSGKNWAITQTIANALSNGQKCLVLAPETHSLKRIHHQFLEAGINAQSFLLRDFHKDKPLFLEQLRRAGEGVKQTSAFQEDAFELQLNKTLRKWQELLEKFRGVNQPIFGNYTWTETVGYFLRSNQQEGKELLNSQLNPNDFVFTFSEYEMLREAIEGSQDLYPYVKTLKHPLTNLHPQIFQNRDLKDASQYIHQCLDDFLEKATALQYRFISKMDGYAEKLGAHFENYYWELRNQLREIQEAIEEYRNTFGADFEESGVVATGKLHVYGVFSNKHKAILRARDLIADQYQQLERRFQEQPYFDYRFDSAGEGRHIKRIRQNLEDFEKTLDHWYRRIPQSVQEEMQRLNSKTIHPGLDFQNQIQELEYSLDVLIEEINEAELYQQPITNNVLTLNRRQQYLEEIIEKLEFTRFNMRDFSGFFPWQKNWLELGPLAQKLIQALIKVKPDDWLSAFESWYFHHRLTLDHSINIPQDARLLESFPALLRDLQETLPAQIKHKWHKRLSISHKGLKRGNKPTFSTLFGKNSQSQAATMPLPQLFQSAPEVITDAIPALLCRPEVASELLLPRKKPLFDLVIIDEAQFIPMEQVLPLLWTGKRILIFGQTDACNSQRGDSILELAGQVGSKQVFFQHIHAPVPHELFAFNQSALYPFPVSQLPASRGLSILPSSNTLLYEVEGRYSEEDGCNEAEAQEVLHILNQIEKTPQHTYPTVTIACTTHLQRDFIANYLLKIKQRRAEGSEKIRQLERNGLTVVTLEELTGLATDILVLSLTFGSKDLRQNLTEDIYLLDTPEVQPYFLQAFMLPCQRLKIVSSLTEDHLDQLIRQENATTGTFLLGKFLSQLRGGEPAASREDLPVGRFPAATFAEEIANALKPYLGEERLFLNQKMGLIHLPLIIRPLQEGAPAVAIIPDGFLIHQQEAAFQWEEYLRDLLKERGYTPLYTWSVNWWRDPKQEARKLASLIIKQDNRQTTQVDS